MITALAEKDYYQQALNAAEKELVKIDELISMEEDRPFFNAFNDLPEGEKRLINPLDEPPEEKVKRWVKHQPPILKSFPGSYQIKTLRGEFVRSKAEYNIANSLLKGKIPYKYESVLITRDGNTERPDFEIMNPSSGEILYWEHFGMLDKPKYINKMLDKLNSFELSGLYPGKNLIVTFDDGSHPLTQEHINQIIDDFLR